MRTLSPRICIAMGDPAGIGSELLARLLARADRMQRACVSVIGDRRILADGERIAGVVSDLPVVAIAETGRAAPGEPVFVDLCNLDAATIRRGEASSTGGVFAMRNFREVLLLAKAGRADGVLFTPFNKLALKLAGNPHPDEIRWADDVLDWKGACSEYNRLDRLWNARVTSHEPLREVPGMLSRVHIASAIEEGRRRGHAVDGPFPADTIWIKARRGDYDAVLSMYHDQGQIALKLLGFERGVTILGGLPVPIATPAHGTAYDIAGRGIADPSATIKAFETLVALAAMALPARPREAQGVIV